MKNIAVSAFSFFTPLIKLVSGKEEETSRIKKGEMYYRRLGRTNLVISEISLGGSPLPDWPLFLQVLERGVNYIDTSCNYGNGNSERQIGRLFKEFGRDKAYVGTKFVLRGGNWSKESIVKSVNASLQRLQTDYVDVLLIHGAEKEEHLTDERVLSAFERLKKEGKYRFRGLSCHPNLHRIVQTAVECGHYDMVMLAYNVFDIQEGEKNIKVYDDYLAESGIRGLITLARSKDMGIIAMKTLKVGGRRQNLEKYKTGKTSLFQAMLKWVLENKNISSVAIEMLTYEQLEEDLNVASSPLSEEERRNLFLYVAKNSKDYCHMCGICQASCPSLVPTAEILRILAYHQSYGKTDLARKLYSELRQEQGGFSCENCGECERVCPYRVSVRKKIKEASLLLG